MKKIFLIMLLFSQLIFATEKRLDIVSIEVLNNKEVPVEVIESMLELKVGTLYTAEAMVKDFVTIKKQDYIADVKLYPEIRTDGIKLIVTVYEKPNAKELLKAKGIIPLSEIEKIDKSLTIKDITISGLVNLKSDQFKDLIPLTVGGYFSKTKALEAKNNLLNTGYFYTVEPDATKFENGVFLNYIVVENLFIDTIEVQGNTLFTTEQIKESMKTKDKSVFNYNDLRSDKDAIEKKYADAGYGLAQVYDVKIDPENKKIVFYIGEGIVRDIVFRKLVKRENEERRSLSKSELKSRDFLLYREVVLEKGKPFETKKFETTGRNLFRLGFFTNITQQFETIPGDPAGRKIVFLLDEQKTASYQGTLSYGSAVGLIGSIAVADNNYKGKGQKLSVSASFGADTSKTYSFDFSDPWLKGSDKLSYGWGVYRQEYQDTDSVNAYNVTKQGVKINSGKGITDTIRLRLGSKLEFVNEKNESKVQKDEYTSLSLIPAIIYDTRNNYYSATSGNYASLDLELGRVLNRHNYYTTELELRKYHKGLFENNNFAYRAVFGTGSENLTDSQKFRVGGGNTLRGYYHSDFKGNNEFFANLENRTKLNDTFEVVGFLDVGRAWDTTNTATDTTSIGKDIKSTYGVGVRLQTPIGPLRFDYGWPINDKTMTAGQFYFNIGQLF